MNSAQVGLDTGGSRQRPPVETRLGRGLPAWAVLAVPALAELVIGGYRLGGPAIWRDEIYTIDASSRSLNEIFALLRHVDAVHGLYYLLMHFVIAVLGTSAQVIRLPSLAAAIVAASVTALLGRRLARTVGLPAPSFTGMLAGVLLAALPRTTFYAQDARPYALVMLCAVAATYLLVRAVADDRPGWWAGYCAALVAAGAFNLFALLLVGAHAMTLLTVRGRARWRHWLAAVAAAALALSPVIYYGYLQRGAVGWLTRPGPHVLARLMASLAGSKTLAPLVAAIALCGVIGGWPHRGGRELTLAAVALPWLLLPAAVLFAVSQLHPVYSPRYVTVSLPALALLAAAGLSWLARVAARSPLANIGTWLAWAPSVLIIALMGALLVGPQRAVRQPNSRHGTSKVAAIIAVNERPGDAVLFVPSRQRAMTYAGPAVWARLRDIALARSPAASASLAGTQVSPAVLTQRLTGVDRVWLVTRRNVMQRKVRLSLMSRTELRLAGTMHLIGHWRAYSTVLRLYCSAAAGNACSVRTPQSQGSRHPCRPLPRASTA